MADAVTVAPDHYKVIEENDRVRILEFRGGPGTKTEMHDHPDVVAIGLTSCKVRFTVGSGQTMEIELPAGGAMFNEAASHQTEVLEGDAHVILVELKG